MTRATRVLIVDDEYALRDCLTDIVRWDGYLTGHAGSAAEALPMLPHFDAVLCDGLEGDWELVAKEAARLGVRFVLLSGDVEAQQAAAAMGCTVVRKPARIEPIMHAIHELENVEDRRGIAAPSAPTNRGNAG